MKFGFGLLGMPPWSAQELADKASQLGFDGVGLRCAARGKDRPGPEEHVSLGMSDEELDAIKKVFDDAGVKIRGIGARTGDFWRVDSDKIDWDAHTEEVAAYTRIAERLGCDSISVQVERADKKPAPGLKWDWEDYLNNLGRASLAGVEGTNLGIVAQNHVWSASAKQLLEMVERIGDSRLGVVFSPDHCIVMQEDPVQLAADHSEAIASIAMADRRVEQQDLGEFDGRYYYVRYECCPVGEGLVPFKPLFDTLHSKGWDGWVNLKYERRLEALPGVEFEPWRSGFTQSGRVGPTPKFGWHMPDGEVVLEAFLPFMESIGYPPNKRRQPVAAS